VNGSRRAGAAALRHASPLPVARCRHYSPTEPREARRSSGSRARRTPDWFIPGKKSFGHLGAGALERYEVIAKMKAAVDSCRYSSAELCAALDVSPRGLYAHQQKAQGVRHQQDAPLAEQISLLFLQSRRTYGCRRIRPGLRRQQVRCATNRVCRLMRQQGLHARQKRRLEAPHHPEPSRRAHRPQPVGPMARAAAAPPSGLGGRPLPTCRPWRKAGATWPSNWTTAPGAWPVGAWAIR
jgi:hypothetical protein